MRSFILIFISFTFVNFAFAAAMPPVTCPPSEKLPEVVYLTKIHGELMISLKLCSESISGFQSYVPVKIQASKNNITQTIEIGRSSDGPDEINQWMLDQTLSFEDINFDGHQDIKMLRWYGATGNRGYLYWLFVPTTSNFNSEPNTALSNLSNPEPNLKTKEICSHLNTGNNQFDKACYLWEKSNLVINFKIQQFFDEEKQQYIKKTTYFSNGALKQEVTDEIPCSESMPCK